MKMNVSNIKNKIYGTVLGVGNAIMLLPVTGVSCSGIFSQSVNIQASNVTASGLLNKIIGVISGVFIIVGILSTISGLFKYLEAKQEENSAAESKAARQMAIGVVFIAAPALIRVIFGG